MRTLFAFLLVFTFSLVNAQDFSGQWKGSFKARGENGSMEYVLEINTEGNEVSGYSYTYPVFGGKKYYDICEIKGTINRDEKYIEIKEVGKVKSNVPPPYRFDCFQTHKLTYTKNDEGEKLSGTWEPAVLSIAVCGYGTTVLEKRKLKDIVKTIKEEATPKEEIKPLVKNEATKKPTPPVNKKPVAKPSVKSSVVTNKPKVTPRPSNQVAAAKPKKPAPPPVVEKNKTLELKKDTASVVVNKPLPLPVETIKAKKLPRFESRVNKVLQTINVQEENITVKLYDNGQIDGDTVTVTFNGDIVALKKGLSTQPIVLNLKAKAGVDNELVMYAENLGSVPPNTALMVVWVDGKRYEVTISSDEKRNGSIIFRREE
jgi:hypothetical protein